MLEQTIRRADFHTECGEITPRFGSLMNDSQIKNLINNINESNSKSLSDRDNAYNFHFNSLLQMNVLGWKLESFASILDVNQIRIQVAIFSREA